MNVIENVNNISFKYGNKSVLDDISLEIRKGEILGILGPNGCGKTTLLKHLNKNLKPETGNIVLLDMDLEELSKKDIAKKISSVPQGNEIRFSFSVRDIISMGRMPFQTQFSGESREDEKIINDAIRKTNLEAFSDKYINEMSGGERQRVIIARALAQTPEILLMDEPTLHLDINTQFDTLDLVSDLSKTEGLTVVMISHDLAMIARYCDRIILIKNHSIFKKGVPEETLTPENIAAVFGVDAELTMDKKTGKYTVLLHGSTKS